jgi:hypothetical protein
MLDTFADAFFVDGSLRDIIVSNTTIDDWESMYREFTVREFDMIFECGDSNTLPQNLSKFLEIRGPHDQCPRLRVIAGANKFSCFFYCQDEIEFDLNPRDVTSEDEFLKVIDFMRTIGACLAKDVILTEESAHDYVLIRYRHEEDDIVPGSSLNIRTPYRELTSEEDENFFEAVRRTVRKQQRP